jgi:hypothetical protein
VILAIWALAEQIRLTSVSGGAKRPIGLQAEEIPATAASEVSPDPDDELFCSCAEAGKADFIITLNPRDPPQHRLRAHSILPGQPIPRVTHFTC